MIVSPLVAFLLCAQVAPPVVVRLLDGARVEATSIELDAGSDRFRLASTGEVPEVSVADIVRIDFSGVTAPFAPSVSVALVDGSLLFATLSDAVEDSLSIEHPALGRMAIPLELVSVIAFSDDSSRPDTARFDPALGEGSDVVWRRGRSEGDRLDGTILRVAKDGVVCASDLGEITLAPRDVLGATLSTDIVPPESEPRRVEIDLREGGFLAGRLVSVRADRIAVDSVVGEGLALPIQRVERVRFAGGRFAWLSDLTPTTIEETPYIGENDEFMFGWRKDKSVTGQALEIGGVRYGKGLGMHSRCRLSFALDDSYVSLEAGVGVCDEVERLGLTGAAIARVLVDGAVIFESGELVAGAPASVIPRIDLKGKRVLTIEVDFGKGGDIGDRVAFVDPLLVRR